MGDVIHALPVVTDIAAARPEVRVDWVIEEAFADLPRLHPAVCDVVPVAVRRWRRELARPSTWAEIRALRARLRGAGYALALDLQGLIKSAVIARWTGAPVAGFDRASVREPLAALAYAKSWPVPRELHAIERLRTLAGQALGYRLEGGPRFALAAPEAALPWRPGAGFAVLLHASARAEKLWPVERWVALGARLSAMGLAVVLPWGAEAERLAAERLAGAIDAAAGQGARAQVAPRLSLRECARLLADAQAVVGVDTGLTHLSAALDRPTVAIFGVTAAWRYGPYWTPRALNLGGDGRWPQVDEVIDALARLGAVAPAA